jgi:hypothetical protein
MPLDLPSDLPPDLPSLTGQVRVLPAAKAEKAAPVIVVDPGYAVDPVHPSDACQVRTPTGAAAQD